jgi:hypothetical protein
LARIAANRDGEDSWLALKLQDTTQLPMQQAVAVDCHAPADRPTRDATAGTMVWANIVD